jgi:hypothetical protein
MKYNCGTCALNDELGCTIHVIDELTAGESTHPSDMHPCEHGKAVVATAIAAITFRKVDDFVMADHDDHLHSIGSNYNNEGWKVQERYGFCIVCGLRLPTTVELEQMYDRAQTEQNRGAK